MFLKVSWYGLKTIRITIIKQDIVIRLEYCDYELPPAVVAIIIANNNLLNMKM